MVMMLSHLA